ARALPTSPGCSGERPAKPDRAPLPRFDPHFGANQVCSPKIAALDSRCSLRRHSRQAPVAKAAGAFFTSGEAGPAAAEIGRREVAFMNSVFTEWKFGAPCEEISFEAEGSDCFAVGRKA